ncbi:uncharacterized protein [Penaeus vannamei]|uniref:uncharacterized protein n=1 Tax=Penaeus vannamei TaxID=6689 RepID=UPI00387F53FA
MADEKRDRETPRASADGEANDHHDPDDQSKQDVQRERVASSKQRQHRKGGGDGSSETPRRPSGRVPGGGGGGGGPAGRHGRRRSEGTLVEYRGRSDEGDAVPTRHRRKGSDGMVPEYHLQRGGEAAGPPPKQEGDVGAIVAELQNHLQEGVAAECVQERKD